MLKKIAYVVGFILLGVVIVALADQKQLLPPQAAQVPSAASDTQQSIKHIVVIVEENKPMASIIGSAAAPYINSLAHKYSQAANYYAVAHPSLPNYLALTSGTTAGITTDCNPPGYGSCTANVPNIADRIEQSGRTWKAYAESMPSPCYRLNTADYAVKHNPFMYYPDIRNNAARCAAHVVPFTQLASDLAANKLPDYVFIVPNLCNDMHNCGVSTGDSWLKQHVPALLQSPAFTRERSLLAIVWDEGYAINNHVPLVLAGSAAKRGYTAQALYTHYSLLHTIEHVWGLTPLTAQDANAPLMTNMLL